MAFERLEVRAASGKKGSPASMSLSCHGGSSRPAAIVAIGAALALEAGFTVASRFSILIGNDDDAGRLRIIAEKDGIVGGRELKGGGLLLNLGYVPVIGIEPCKKKPTEARLIAEHAVEVHIPDFTEGRPRLLAPPQPARVAAVTVPAQAEARPPKGETYHGVTIDFTEDEESVSFRGRAIELSREQAILVKTLARPMPQPVAESFLIKACWGSAAPKNSADILRQMTSDLRSGLAPLGLDLKPIKGVGYQIKVA